MHLRLPMTAFALLTLPAIAQTPAASTAEPASGPSTAVETKELKDARMGWWREARFGMFIHWGIYSVPAGVYGGKNIPSIGEWIMNNASIPVADYAKFAEGFNPTKFNADEFVTVAKKAGMKYIVITAKHHDGFAMFKSAASPFNIVDATPFKRDVIRELETAARKAGLRFGVYYSQVQDWHHAGGFSMGRAGRKDAVPWDPAQGGSFDEYLNQIAIPQTRELLSNYKLDVLWWDTPGKINKEQATKLHDLLSLQPSIITNNRLMNPRTPGAFQGDTETPEQSIPSTGFPGGRDWETCMTINDTWGYKSTDTRFKSTEKLLRNLIDIASKGGNYLLNVGPTAEGEIPAAEVERLAEMGKWLATNGEAIYGSGPNPFDEHIVPTVSGPATTSIASTAPTTAPATGRAPVVWDYRVTTKPGKIYFHIFKWPENGAFALPTLLPFPPQFISKGQELTVSRPPPNILKAYLLADPDHTPIRITTVKSGMLTIQILNLPTAAPDPIASVVCVELGEKPEAQRIMGP